MKKHLFQRYWRYLLSILIVFVLLSGFLLNPIDKLNMASAEGSATENVTEPSSPLPKAPLVNGMTLGEYLDSQGYRAGDEIPSMRTKTSKTIWLGDEAFRATFVGSPEYTEAPDKSLVPYIFTEEAEYYQVQHPFVSARLYGSYMSIYDESFNKTLVENESWTVQYKNEREEWVDVPLHDATRSYEVVEDGIKLTRSGDTDIGQRTETYYFRNGSPVKITIVQNTTEAQEVQFSWQLTGIQAANLSDIRDVIDDTRIGVLARDENGIRVGQILWEDALDSTPSIAPDYESDARGQKITVTFGTFKTAAGGQATLDPTGTFYPDYHPETTTVDGCVYEETPTTANWSTIKWANGDVANDYGVQLPIAGMSQWSTTVWDRIYRGIFLFDTSSIGDAANITSANMSVYGFAKNNAGGWSTTISVFKSAPSSDTSLVAGDYDEFTPGTPLSDSPITYNTFNTSGYNNFPLNANGIALINKTGVTKFGTLEATYDAGSSTPSLCGTPDANGNMNAYMSEQGNHPSGPEYGYKPTLVVSYDLDYQDDGLLEVGGIYNADYQNNLIWPDRPTTENITRGFVDYLENNGWQERFIYGDVDEESPFTGDDNLSADGVDIFFYCGHGNVGSIPLVDDWWPLPHVVSYEEAEWGETDLEWVFLFACNTLQNDDAYSANYTKENGEFAQSLNGAHIICGADTPMSAEYTEVGEAIAYLLVEGYDVGMAWFVGGLYYHPVGTTLRIIYEEEFYFNPETGEYDYIWGCGDTQPDVSPDEDFYSADATKS